jgi:hypothetical protein
MADYRNQPFNREISCLPSACPTYQGVWFATVEGKFLLRDIDDEPSRFYNCLQALPETTGSGGSQPAARRPLSDACECEAHGGVPACQHQAGGVAIQSPFSERQTELLAKMLRLCPRGQDNNDLFNYLYLNKLPRER